MCVCVCERVCGCVCVCVRACVRACVCVSSRPICRERHLLTRPIMCWRKAILNEIEILQLSICLHVLFSQIFCHKVMEYELGCI